jgi:hypothetical protein
MPSVAAACVNRDETIQPLTQFNPGTQNQVMLVKACAIFDSIFPGFGLGRDLIRADGGYAVAASSVFANEPS